MQIPKSQKNLSTVYTEDEIREIFSRFSAWKPDPQSDLKYTSPYTLLVAVVLSAQATDAGVNRATEALFMIADTPEKIVKLGQEELARHIRTIGLWRNKAKNIIALSKLLLEYDDGGIPDTREALMSLPGVGRKTANVVLNIVFHKPTLAVDTHIFRIANRLGLARGKTPEDVEKKLLQIIPETYLQRAHHWLVLHGRYVCKARNPECKRCIISDLCKASVNVGNGLLSSLLSSDYIG